MKFLALIVLLISSGCNLQDVSFSTSSQPAAAAAAVPTTPEPPSAPPVCSPTDLDALGAYLVQSPTVPTLDVATACIDPDFPNAVDSLPRDAWSKLRYTITCGNRYCNQKGFDSGRVVEIFDVNNVNQSIVQCMHASSPETGNSCEGVIKGNPLVVVLQPTTTEVAKGCTDSDVPDYLDSLPSQNSLRFATTCGFRYCEAHGFRDGHVIENYLEETHVQCFTDPESLFSQQQVSIEDVARNCEDAAVPTLEGSLPGADELRFIGTCANRYCQRVLQQKSGSISEYRDGLATLTCVR